MRTGRVIESRHWNGLYLLAAVAMIFVTLSVAVQPLFLRAVLHIPFASAGAINTNVAVVTEILSLLLVGYLGYLSDRVGRVPIVVVGFFAAGVGAALAPFSLSIGTALGIGGVAFYYGMRIVMALGAGAVWPQLSALVGDFSNTGNRARLMANTAFMTAFGATLVYAVLMQIPPRTGVVTVMLITAGIAFIGAWLTRKCLIDVAPRLDERHIPWRRIGTLLRTDSRMRLAFLSAFFARSDMVLIGMFFMLWYIYFGDLVGVTQEAAAAQAGKLIGLVGIVVLVSIPFWGAFIERHGRIAAITVGMAMSGLGFAGLGFVVNPYKWYIVVPTILAAAGQAGCLVAPQVLAIDLAPREILGSVLGAFNLVGGIGIIVFLEIGGLLFDAIGPYAPFVFTGIGNLLIMCYSLWVLVRSRGDARVPAEEGV
ncbi:MAG: MFS transporter [Alphaproteobacteria bacterium]|nr:MFS transporter [Alphaproteobacteria bacterium]MBF0129249.1 MFS transporter [Alphaproteobacteria bacterium]